MESSEIEGLFCFQFNAFLRSKPIGKTFPHSLGYQCFAEDAGQVRNPDTTVILLDRLRQLPDPNPRVLSIVPDLAVHTVLPNHTFYELDETVKEYLDAGFPLVWVADPKARSITVYPQGGRPTIHTADDELTADPPLPGFRCKVADFFPPATPK